jgi:protein-S-isoprenylcysteine O-methyltransferase Ste14
MWIIRLALLGLLAILVGTSGYFLKHRARYGRLLENGPANLISVVLYNLLCYVIVALPSELGLLHCRLTWLRSAASPPLAALGMLRDDAARCTRKPFASGDAHSSDFAAALPSEQSIVPPPEFLAHSGAQDGFSVVGQVLMGLAALVMVTGLVQRKALGGQESKAGLLTSGVYRYARHPIYTGIFSMSLGLALASVNWEGLLMVPAVFAANLTQAVIEERYDVGLRFRSQYETYRKRTRMFGPVWCWVVLGGILALLAGVPYLSSA